MSGIFGKIVDAGGKAAHDAERAAHVKKIEVDIGGIRKQIEDQYTKLGELTYKSKVNNEAESPDVAAIMSKIGDFNKQISEKMDMINKINAEVAPQGQPSPGKKVCPSCGKENDASVKFCAECGAKLS